MMSDENAENQFLKDLNSPNIRARGELGSKQNQLRYNLYKAAFERMESALASDNVFEVISIADSLITDRLQALIQFLRKEEPKQYTHVSIGKAQAVLIKEMRQRDFSFGDEIEVLVKEINSWVPHRNKAAHGFVVVTHKDINEELEDRLKHLRTTAKDGLKLARKTTTMTTRTLRNLHSTNKLSG